MEVFRCERCNHILRSAESIKRGYGKTCYRIVQLQEANKPEPEVNDEIAFLKMEIKTLKRMIRNIQVSGTTAESIERIKKEVIRIPDIIKEGFGNVVKEMKTIFKENFHYTDVLKPAFPNEEIVAPPVLIQVLS